MNAPDVLAAFQIEPVLLLVDNPDVAKEYVATVLQVHAPRATMLERNISYGDLVAILETNQHRPLFANPLIRTGRRYEVVFGVIYDGSFTADPNAQAILCVDQARIDGLRVKGIQSNVVSIINEVVASQQNRIGIEVQFDMIFKIDGAD